MFEEERRAIDKIDYEIAGLLAKRAALCEQIGKEKAKQNAAVFDGAREAQVLKNAASVSGKYADFVTQVYKSVLTASKNLQTKVEKP